MALEPLKLGPTLWSAVCVVRPIRKETGNPVKLTAIASNMTVEKAQTSPKGAKSAPLRCEGKPIAWTHMLWEPSSFGEDQGPRQNVCFAMERGSEAWGAWDDFEKKCVNELSLRPTASGATAATQKTSGRAASISPGKAPPS